MKVPVVLRHGPCDVTRLALADYEHVHPLPVGQPLLVLMLQPDVDLLFKSLISGKVRYSYNQVYTIIVVKASHIAALYSVLL